jgi:hypothetical protein
MRHQLNNEIAIRLLHQHFNLDADEKLVEHGPVSSPWPISAAQDRVTGGYIVPKSWRLYNGELYPYEFRFRSVADTEQDAVSIKFPQAFVIEISDVLKETCLDKILGITIVDHALDSTEVELMEITYGRNSVMIPAVEQEIIPETSFQASWAFVEKNPEGHHGKHGACINKSPHDNGVVTKHGLCINKSPHDNGVATKHGLCINKSPHDNGIVIKHGLCINKSPHDNGVVTKHGVSINSSPHDNGIISEHVN